MGLAFALSGHSAFGLTQAQVTTPVAQVSATVATQPKEIVSADYQPITDPENVKKFVSDYFADTPVLAKVALCESQYRQYDTRGNILRGVQNASDVGIMQINEEYHAREAAQLGLDIYTADGNVAFAKYLYSKYGVKPWMSSSPCWSKSNDLAYAK